MAISGDNLDNLEYYIKFPNPNFNYQQPPPPPSQQQQQNGNESDYVFVVNEEKIPVILLFGWAGCQDKYLAKYSQIYEDKGLITLRYIAPVKLLFWKHYQVVKIGEKLVKLLFDLNFETHPIIIHCFSNGGAFLYQNFIHALQKNSKNLLIKGVIFDSAPGKRRIISIYRAISAILGGNKFYNIPMTFMTTMLLSIVWYYEIIMSYLTKKIQPPPNPYGVLINEKNLWPQHFIYSKADILISYKDVESFVNIRKSMGVDVTTLRYDDSPHVKHYTNNKDSYVNSVYNFINKCLSGVN